MNRSFRRATRQTLAEPTDDAQSLQDNVREVKRINWKKVPDKPLGDHLFDKLIRKSCSASRKHRNQTSCLDDLEHELIENEVPSQAVQEVMSQLRGIALAQFNIVSAWLAKTAIPNRLPSGRIDLRNSQSQIDIALGCSSTAASC